jgi:hypothetical protein
MNGFVFKTIRAKLGPDLFDIWNGWAQTTFMLHSLRYVQEAIENEPKKGRRRSSLAQYFWSWRRPLALFGITLQVVRRAAGTCFDF